MKTNDPVFGSFLKEIDEKATCRCGGLPYDLEIKHKGKTYSFALWKIKNRSGRTIAQTDFKKLGESNMVMIEFRHKDGSPLTEEEHIENDRLLEEMGLTK